MLPKENLRRADFVFALLLIALGISVIAGAFQMPLGGTYGGRPIHWYTSPAFFPLIVGSLLICCSIGILIRAIADGGHRNIVLISLSTLRSLTTNTVAHRILAIWAIFLGYILGLALHPFARLGGLLDRLNIVHSSLFMFMFEPEGMNYVVSSFVFLGVFMFVFYRPAKTSWSWKRGVAMLSMSLIVAWAVGYLFTQHLYSPLPW